MKATKARKAKVKRETSEVSVSVSLNLSGKGKSAISTGIGFFDHMLEQLSRHSLIDMEIQAKGDKHVDFHHTVEDVGIALGAALDEALAERRGVIRYASLDLAMDEALTRAAVDLSGRAFLDWRVSFTSERIGDFDVELVGEFFRALAQNARITLHVENLHGRNAHHVAETCFKATGRVLRAACEIDPRSSDAIPSTKGKLKG